MLLGILVASLFGTFLYWKGTARVKGVVRLDLVIVRTGEIF